MEAWTKELAVLLSVFTLVSCWGWPMASRRLQRPIAVWLLWNSTPHSASVAEQTTYEGVWIGSAVEIARDVAFCTIDNKIGCIGVNVQLHVASKKAEYCIWICCQ
eukprot:2875673-Ditylum_brightwellii.AAC.1